ncbi:hypothetical protein KFK09_006910 [Dendrobium nobile]|uniref:Serine/threonine-protein phosphatase 7 long form-like n=1 Tax=Dendrobium nobile TaxID=94219 RepID=A0A8T3BQI9_DENNO|nr:hypothetical protein KFK09_006910 [Dendrobium nobile]
MCFTRKTDLQFALQGWAIKNNVQYIVIASNRTKFTIVCAKHDCPVYPCLWRLHSAQSKRLGGVWKISSIKNQHRCVSPILDSGHRQCNSQFISFYILPTIRKHMDLKPREIIGRMESKFNIKVSYMKAWDARRKAIKVVFGSWEESYRTLNLFMDAVASVMPGTVYRIQSTQTNRFQRLFWTFGPSITGWKYCRPVLSLDGTFLLGKYRGTLLTTIGMDANNGLYPLAFTVVESECTESWIWFLRQVNELLPVVTKRPNLCIISDRHAGLVRGCREIFPNVAHRYCLRHLRENFKKAIRQMGIGDVDFLCQKMYAAGNTDDKAFFNRCMEDMRRIKVDIHQWLVDRDVKWHQTNDVAERKGQLVSLPERGTILEAASHLLMVHDWPVNCPRFMEALRLVGLDCVSQMRYLRMDHHLLTALVERWSPQTNSFHLTVGEMTITLQDVAMILGVNIDGPALVGHTVVGAGRRWLSWPDCCDDLLGSHPLADVVYRDPFDHRITSRFRMGQAHAQTCIPLRWLRWTFWRDSYLDLNDMDFWRHVRAYILFILGCHLLPDTSGSEIHLQYLTIMEDLAVFSTYSLGGAVLAHLYRELGEATRPSRANIAGCINLLQIWAWEHLHVGRPLLRVPFPVELDGLSVGFRWNEDRLRELPVGNLITYRDELDGLLDSQVIWQPYTPDIQAQVAQICLSGADIWTARVPLISWKRVEWHLPDRVLRQFGLCPRTDIQPMDPSFKRVDGRGKPDMDWMLYHQAHIAVWEIHTLYKSWATLYMLKAPVEAPTTAYPRAPSERLLRDFFLGTEQALQQHFNGIDDTPQQRDINTIAELCRGLRRQMYIEDQGYFEDRGEHEAPFSMTQEPPHQYSGYVGPSSYPDQGPSTDLFSSQVPTDLEAYLSPDFVPSSIHTDDIAEEEAPEEEQHMLRQRPRRPPQHYTPGTDALPQRPRRRR